MWPSSWSSWASGRLKSFLWMLFTTFCSSSSLSSSSSSGTGRARGYPTSAETPGQVCGRKRLPYLTSCSPFVSAHCRCSRGCREAGPGPGAASGCPTESGSTRVCCPRTSSDGGSEGDGDDSETWSPRPRMHFQVLVCRTAGSGPAQTWESLLQWSEVRMRPGRLLGRSSRLKYHTRFQ